MERITEKEFKLLGQAGAIKAVKAKKVNDSDRERWMMIIVIAGWRMQGGEGYLVTQHRKPRLFAAADKIVDLVREFCPLLEKPLNRVKDCGQC